MFFKVQYPHCASNTKQQQKILPSTHNITVAIINGSYMCQLHSSPHQAVMEEVYKQIIHLQFTYN